MRAKNDANTNYLLGSLLVELLLMMSMTNSGNWQVEILIYLVWAAPSPLLQHVI